MSIARVCSIAFCEAKAERSIYGGYYYMPPVPLGDKPYILDVADKVQRDEGPVSTGPGDGKRQQLRYHVDCYHIALDIVSQMTQHGLGMTPAAHPGIWIIRDRLPLVTADDKGNTTPVFDGFNQQMFRPATTEEMQAMWDEDLIAARKADRAYAEWCYIDGNRIAADVRNIQFIPRNYKLAARQYGLEADWLKEGAALEVKPCVYCTKIISKRAIVCPHCQQVNDNERYAAMQVSRDNAVREAKKQAQAA